MSSATVRTPHSTNTSPRFFADRHAPAIDIEKQLTVSDANSTEAKPIPFVPLANGCICCSVKDVGVAAIENLMEQRGGFDYILLETTGLADPGNIAPLFWLDDGLGSSIFLDGIVTLVDAKNVLKSLDEGYGDENADKKEAKESHEHDEHGPLLTTAHLQISHADVVLVNKADLVSEAELAAVVERIRSINGLARVQTTTRSQVPQLEGLILDIHAYDEVTDADLKFSSKGHSHIDPVSFFIGPQSPVLASLAKTSLLTLFRQFRHRRLRFLPFRPPRSLNSMSFCELCCGRMHSRTMFHTQRLRYIG